MTRAIAVALLCLFAWATTADAKPRHIARSALAESNGCVLTNEGHKICSGAVQAPSAHARVTAAYSRAGVIGGRHAGCPRAFCGCEASLYVFGRIIPELNLAANWLRKFPRTAPGPGMVAARNHHVFVLISHVGGSDWLAHDGNSGGGKTREHIVSISRYTIVNPHGERVAMH